MRTDPSAGGAPRARLSIISTFLVATAFVGCVDEPTPAPGLVPSSPPEATVGAGGEGGAYLGEGGTLAVGGGGGAGAGGAGGAGADDGGFDQPLVCEGTGPLFATHVLATSFGPGQDWGRDQLPGIVTGPPEGGGCCGGSLDVCSLGHGGSITVGFAGNGIVDGPGPDFIVFENPFEFGDATFAELATVEVSADGESWYAFPCEAVEPPFDTCAGHHPVHLYGAPKEPLDPVVHGGDPFDLADLGLTEARFVRITDRPDLDGALDGVFDLDAVGILHPACE